MPIGPTNLGYLETHPHIVKFYLVVHQPRTVMAARVNGAPSGDPVLSITYDGISEGAYANIEAGQTLLIGSEAGGDDRGIVRIKSADATTITIAESSDLLDVNDNDYLTVLRDHRLWIKYPRIVSETEMYEDYDEAWVDEDTAYGPMSLLGPCGFVFKDDAANVSLDYDLTDSYPIAGGSISSYAAVTRQGDTGSFATGTFTETYSTATGMAGSETKVTVTDDNGKTGVGWRYDFILNRPDRGYAANTVPIKNFLVDQPISVLQEGSEEIEFTVYGSDAAKTSIKDGVRVWIIYESWYGSTKVDIPTNYIDRANILFEGWVKKDTVSISSDHSVVTFTAIPTIRQMAELMSYPATLGVVTNTPSKWTELSSCTPSKACLYLAKWRSTLSEIVDIHIPASDTDTTGKDWPKASLKDQFMDMLDEGAAFIAADKAGQMWIEKDVNLLPTADRSTIDLMLLTEKKHWIPPLDIIIHPENEGSYIFAEGVSSDGTPYFSEAPGIAAAYRGITQQKVPQLAIDDQDHINQLSGDYFAKQNPTYPDITLKMAGFWPCFDVVPQKRVRIGVGASDNERGISISGTNFLVVGCKVIPHFDSLWAETELTLIEETDGLDGQTVTYPDTVPTNPLPPRPVPRYDPIPIDPETGDTGARFLATDKGVFYCANLSTPIWVQVNSGLPGGEEQCWLFNKDYHHWDTSGTRKLWGIFGAHNQFVYVMDNFPSGTWELSLSSTGAGWGLAPSPRVCSVKSSPTEDTIYAIMGCGSGYAVTWFAYRSRNGGDSWSYQGPIAGGVKEQDVVGDYPYTRAALQVSASDTDTLYFLLEIFASDADLYKSTNHGISFNILNTAVIGAAKLHDCYKLWRGGSDSYQVVNGLTLVTDGVAFRKSINSGAGWANAGPSDVKLCRAMSYSPYNPNVMAGLFTATNGFDMQIFITIDGGTTWSEWMDIDATLGASPQTASPSAAFTWSGLGNLVSVLFWSVGDAKLYLCSKPLGVDTVTDVSGTLSSIYGVTEVAFIERDVRGYG